MLKLTSPLIALLLLATIGFARMGRDNLPQGAEEYHARVQEAVHLLPYRIGTWVGVDTELRRDALQILNPNVALSRTYRDVQTGRTGTLVVVHCSDARSLLGHYPPACYPTQGWTTLNSSPKQIELDSLSVPATEYLFRSDWLANSGKLCVLHFTVLPDGQIVPDMRELEHSARDKRTKMFGGASLQLIVDADLPAAQRDEIYEVLVSAAADWIMNVQRGSDT